MTIEILREFADLAYTLNYQKTAERMYISHSTLSKHIMALEKELGNVTLFHRSKHSVELTDLGKAFLTKIQKTLADYDSALSVIQKGKENISGTICIGFLDAAVKDFLPPILDEYRNIYPEMNVELFSGQVGDLLEAYGNNQSDLSITLFFPNAVPPSSAAIRILTEESLSVVFPKGHPLENKEKIFINDILPYPLVLPSRQQYADYAALIEDYIENGPFPPNVICDFTHVDTALIMTEANMGISILPTNISRKQTDLVFREINDFHPILELVVVWNKRRINPGTLEFIELLCERFPEYYQSN
ncbi:transcriptional regulator [Clostridium sp. SY8519]|uniref:LysR family transcriptional regulator n=1 Tax=Clostridium sp. (strain SY8519) TaxID=1042156 RepID=UPI0002171B65|nr:LysR family transcriptional regulator [Clostridium sp. SY8519]BAK47577.1 transcriptional regulator [Clostridium sp. SY8519]